MSSLQVGIIAFIPAEKKPFEDFKFKDKSGKIKDLPSANTRTDLKSLQIKQNASILRLTKSGTSQNSDVYYDKINGIWVTLTCNSSNYETIALGHFNNCGDWGYCGQYFLLEHKELFTMIGLYDYFLNFPFSIFYSTILIASTSDHLRFFFRSCLRPKIHFGIFLQMYRLFVFRLNIITKTFLTVT